MGNKKMLKRTQEEIMRKWPKECDNPLVSICCTTYNHEKYITNTLDGFLIQNTDFPFEVIVHDDASTDCTANIIRKYEIKYPRIIKPIYEKENQYSKKDDSIFRIILPYLKGKYVAFCEGDDYWCCPNKLTKQVYALEQHPECSICTHNVQPIYENGDIKQGCLIPGKKINPGVVTQDEYAYWLLLKAQCTFQFSSYFFKSDYLFEIEKNKPYYFKFAHVSDEKYQRYCLNKGKLFFIPDVMSCYRLQSINSWTLREFSSIANKKKHCDEMIKLDEAFDIFSNHKFSSYIEEGKKERFLSFLVQTKQFKEIFRKENREKLPSLKFSLMTRYKLYSFFPFLQKCFFVISTIKRFFKSC